MPIPFSFGAASLASVGLLRNKYLYVRILQQPPPTLNVASGENKTITVVAQGSTPISYQWYLNSQLIPGATQSSVSTSYGAGEYYVVVSDSYINVQSTSTTVTIGSNEPGTAPLIIDNPVDTTIERGGTAIFTVSATGAAPLNYEWIDELDMPAGVNSSVLQIVSYSPNFYANDQKSYKCKVSNAYGYAISSSAKLTVVGEAPVITSITGTTTIYQTEIVNLNLTASGYPTPEVEWFLPPNNTRVAGGEAVFYADPAIFTTTTKVNVNWRVGNIYGSLSGSVEINIKQVINPTVITPFPQTLTIIADPDEITTSSFFGEFVSDPPFQTQFTGSDGYSSTQGGANQTFPFSTNPRSSTGGWPAVKDSTSSTTADNYTPTQINIPYSYDLYFYPTASWQLSYPPPLPPSSPTKVTVTIQKPILLEQPPAVVTANVSSIVCFNAYAQSSTALTYSWYRNSTLVSSGVDNYSLCVEVANYGQNNDEYQCTISNSAGTVTTRKSVLRVQANSPIIIISPESKLVGDQDLNGVCLKPITFTANVVNSEDQRIKEFIWYVNGILTQDWSVSPYYIFNNCDCADIIYAIQAKARFQGEEPGLNFSTAEVVLNEITPSIITEPQDQSVDPVATATFTVDVCRSSLYIYQWYRINYIAGNTVKINGANTNILNILAQVEDNGNQYFCEISLPDGSKLVTTRYASLNVLGY